MLLRTVLIASMLWLCAAPSLAATFGFSCLTNFDAALCTGGETDLELEITAGSTGQVSLVVRNLSSPGDVEAFYVSSSALIAGFSSVTSTPDVSFILGATDDRPAILRGGEAFSWPIVVATSGSGMGAQEYVSAGEEVQLILDLASNVTAADVMAAVQSGSLRIGVLLDDESLITVPEPAVLTLVSALGTLVLWRRRLGVL